MSLYNKIRRINSEISDTERLLKLVSDHPLMGKSLSIRLEDLKKELEAIPQNATEAKISLLFSGDAVVGSSGIKSNFVSKAVKPFQEIVKTQAALHRFGRVKGRGRAKGAVNSELYLTALPRGSFGLELSQLQTDDLFDSSDLANALREVIDLVRSTSLDDQTFEAIVENVPRRNLSNLKKFLHAIVEENSVLKMESGDLGIELTKEKVREAYYRVAATTDSTEDIVTEGVFRGLLLDSSKFEILDVGGNKISGFISEELTEDQLVEYDKDFLNEECIIHLRIHRTTFATGNKRSDYELLQLQKK